MSVSSPPASSPLSVDKKSGNWANKEKEKEKGDGRTSMGGGGEVTIEDLSMPKSIIQRLGKSSLPTGTQIQKDAITAMSKSSTVFISQLAAAAQVHTSASGKKTTQPHDIMAALRDLEFDFMIPHLEAELSRWREKEANKRSESRKKAQSKAEEKKEGTGEEMTAERQLAEESGISTGAGEKMTIREIDREKSAKRVRGSTGLPIAMNILGEDEEDMAGIDGGAEEEGEEEDVGDDIEDEDGDETQEEETEGIEDRVGTEDEKEDETEEQEDSD